jgi:hypothetical protein
MVGERHVHRRRGVRVGGDPLPTGRLDPLEAVGVPGQAPIVGAGHPVPVGEEETARHAGAGAQRRDRPARVAPTQVRRVAPQVLVDVPPHQPPALAPVVRYVHRHGREMLVTWASVRRGVERALTVDRQRVEAHADRQAGDHRLPAAPVVGRAQDPVPERGRVERAVGPERELGDVGAVEGHRPTGPAVGRRHQRAAIAAPGVRVAAALRGGVLVRPPRPPLHDREHAIAAGRDVEACGVVRVRRDDRDPRACQPEASPGGAAVPRAPGAGGVRAGPDDVGFGGAAGDRLAHHPGRAVAEEVAHVRQLVPGGAGVVGAVDGPEAAAAPGIAGGAERPPRHDRIDGHALHHVVMGGEHPAVDRPPGTPAVIAAEHAADVATGEHPVRDEGIEGEAGDVAAAADPERLRARGGFGAHRPK